VGCVSEKEVAEDMKSDFIIALTQLASERNLPREIVLSAIEAALISAYKKDSIAAGQDISVKLDPGSGEVSVYIVKTVVEDLTDPQQELTLAQARELKPDAEIGDVVPTESLPHSAGRIAAQTAKQVVIQRLREAEREVVFQEYADKEGEVFTVTIQRMEQKQIIVELGRAEAILPPSEQAPFERYRVGQRLKVLLQSIRQSNKGPEIIVSRADKLLVKRLFEMEVPEIYNGSVEIVEIAREPGSRTKVAVWAKQDGVDAVGSCVGLRGIRIQNIVNEFHGEKIDVVQWDKNPAKFIASALSPSMVLSVDIDSEAGTAVVVVPDRQLSLAIGKEGQNARLAARLTGLKVDIKSHIEVQEAEQEKPEAEVPAQVATKEEAVAAVDEAVKPALEPVEEAPKVEVVEEEGQAPEPAEVLAAEQPADVPVAQVEAAEVQAPPQEAAAVEPKPVPAEVIPEEPSIPEKVKEPVLAGEQATSIQDLPENIWNLRGRIVPETGAIRFAEDIEELKRGAGSRSGRRGGGRRRTGAPAGRGRRSKAGKKR
jgi:N utilization substance protein A